MTCREHAVGRPSSSFDRLLAEAPMSEAEFMRLRKAAYGRQFYTFTEAELAKLGTFAEAAIRSAAKEIFER